MKKTRKRLEKLEKASHNGGVCANPHTVSFQKMSAKLVNKRSFLKKVALGLLGVAFFPWLRKGVSDDIECLPVDKDYRAVVRTGNIV